MILQVPDGKGIIVTANYAGAKCIHGVQMCYNGRLGSLLSLQLLSTMQSKSHCSVSLSCGLYDSLHIVGLCTIFLALRATLIVAVLQAPDGKDSG